MPSARGADDRIYGRLDERLRAGHLDLDLLVKLQEELRSSPHRHCVTLTTVTAGARDGDARDAGAEQGFLDGGEAVGPDNTADEFHRSGSTRKDGWVFAVPELFMSHFTVLLQRDR